MNMDEKMPDVVKERSDKERSDIFEPTLNADLADAHEEAAANENVIYKGSHADNYDPEHTPDPDGPRDKPSGENTKNNGERGGGLWTSGGQITTGTGYNEPDR